MRETIVRCDRCAATITEGAAVLAIDTGDLRDRLPNPLDLCATCARKLFEWLSTARTDGQEKRS